MGWKVITLLIAATFAVIFTFIGRYEIIAVPAGGEGSYGTAYRLDRWTGEVKFIYGDESDRVHI